MTAPVESRPNQVRWPQPGELWSLWDMNKWDGVRVAQAQDRLATANQLWFTCLSADQSTYLRGSDREGLLGCIRFLARLAEEHDFDVVADFAASAEKTLESQFPKLPNTDAAKVKIDPETLKPVQTKVDQLLRALESTLKGRVFFTLSKQAQKLYSPKEPLFGAEVFVKFEKSQRDIDEAGKCLALRRNKAVVFHLMLAMEEALRALAARINVNVLDKNGQFERWLVIVSNVKAAIPALPPSEQENWTEVHNLLWGVGKSWRNGTMHPAETYTDEEAETVFDAVKGFMRYLAPLV